jgi:hypothetical protein
MEYVSPIDPRTQARVPQADRPQTLEERRVVLLDISQRRSREFLDRIEVLLHERGATTSRHGKPTPARPATADLIEEIAIHGDLVVEGLAD